MGPAFLPYDRRGWWQRDWQELLIQNFHKCIWFFYVGLLILLLELAAVAFLSDQIPLPFAVIMAVSGTVFIVLVVFFTVREACQNSEATTFNVQELANLSNTRHPGSDRAQYC